MVQIRYRPQLSCRSPRAGTTALTDLAACRDTQEREIKNCR